MRFMDELRPETIGEARGEPLAVLLRTTASVTAAEPLFSEIEREAEPSATRGPRKAVLGID